MKTKKTKNPYPKVLVGIVTYEGKDYCWDKFWRSIQRLDYPNMDVMIVDNSTEKDYYHKLHRSVASTRVFVEHVGRGKTSREAQARSLNKIRARCLTGGYDYLMLIESDLMPPSDIIERLITHNVLCVGSIYLIGFKDSKTQPPRPCLFKTAPGANQMLMTVNLPPDEGYSYFGTGLREIHGCGFGCTLIKRALLEEFHFWYYIDEPVKHSDVLWYMDLHNHGYKAYVDTDFIIPHYNSNWAVVKDV